MFEGGEGGYGAEFRVAGAVDHGLAFAFVEDVFFGVAGYFE